MSAEGQHRNQGARREQGKRIIHDSEHKIIYDSERRIIHDLKHS